MHRAHCGSQCVAALRTACLALGWEAACAGLEAAWKEELSKGLSGAFLRDAVHDPSSVGVMLREDQVGILPWVVTSKSCFFQTAPSSRPVDSQNRDAACAFFMMAAGACEARVWSGLQVSTVYMVSLK